MTDRVAAAKAALLQILADNDGVADPKQLLQSLSDIGFNRREIHSALQTALGQNEVGVDDNLRFALVKVLQAA